MTEETDTQEGSEALAPDEQVNPQPEQEAPEQEQEVEQPEQGEQPEPEPPKEPDESKKRNRTRDYINRINRENAELRAKLKENEPAPAKGEKPKLEDYNFDQEQYLEALADYKAGERIAAHQAEQQQADTQRQQQEIEAAYTQRIASFADEHPDFPEVVGSIPYPLSPDVQAAIMAHENGPEIAYHLGTNDDEAFALASIQPHLASAAVERLASRLTAAPKTPQTTSSKPVSKAPAPAPTVSGRSPTEIPPEKLTDDEWFKRERERARKR